MKWSQWKNTWLHQISIATHPVWDKNRQHVNRCFQTERRLGVGSACLLVLAGCTTDPVRMHSFLIISLLKINKKKITIVIFQKQAEGSLDVTCVSSPCPQRGCLALNLVLVAWNESLPESCWKKLWDSGQPGRAESSYPLCPGVYSKAGT